MSTLKIFLSANCFGCEKALALARHIREMMPQLKVKIIYLEVGPDAVTDLMVAVPAYVYQNNPLFLGNPSPKELQSWLESLDLAE